MADKHSPPASSSHTSPLTSASPKVQGICFLSSRPEATPTSLLFSHSVVSDSATPRTAACQASLSFTIFQSLLKLMSIDAIQLSHPLRPLLLLPSIFPIIRVFSNESALHIRWPKYWSFSFSISPSSEYSGLISFRIDQFDLFAVQGTLKSLLQYHSSKASILRPSLWSTSHIHT